MKNAFGLLALCGYLTGLVLIPAMIAQAPVRRIQLPVAEPVRDPAARLSEAFPDRPSTVTLTVRIPFAQLAALAEAAVPATFGTAYDAPDTGGVSGIRVSPNLTRDPLGLTPVIRTTPPQVQLASRLHGRVGVKGFKWIIFDILGKRVKTKSFDVEENLAVDATINGWVSPGINSAWAFTHRQELKVVVKQADFKLFGVFPISLTKELQQAIDAIAPGPTRIKTPIFTVIPAF